MGFKLKEFLKAQLSAFLGGMTDLAIYSFCYKVLSFSAPFSNAIAGSLGAIVNFLINRYWSFGNTSTSIGTQLWKFVIVVIGSISLKSAGLYFFVNMLGWHFLVSKLLVEVIVSLGFNFTLQKFWVFKK
ncbi:putative flippase GtrA [Sphingobacterium alimentarium]|uniref:Putative flippase GtrA n=1 Tax=Sphingobacterium alimentarium TaxID=797292 RepID=A0A4R3VQG4_9SPHI|nr:GtrA family protein [Sphingobacterium alimentarium]TCV05636.1 putative flippase GtrA [Sphingobacterium alimentarium]